MATKKTTKKAATTAKASRSTAQGAEFKSKGLEGKAQRGKEWDPSAPEAAAPDAAEVNEPRPYTSRYPIPDDAFRALKEAAPKAKLPKKDAEISKDKAKKEEITAAAVAPELGMEPVAAPSA